MEITIKLKVKDVTIELTTQEARDLADALRALTLQPVTIPTVVPYIEPWWWQPLPSHDWRYWRPTWTTFTCGGTADKPMEVQYSDPGGPVTIYQVSDHVSLSVLL